MLGDMCLALNPNISDEQLREMLAERRAWRKRQRDKLLSHADSIESPRERMEFLNLASQTMAVLLML